jgi:hypothetical protein
MIISCGFGSTVLGTKMANVSRNTVVNFEGGQRALGVDNLAAIRSVLETAGVEFIDFDGRPGVRLRTADGCIIGAAGRVSD